MKYHIEKEMVEFGPSGDVAVNTQVFYYFPKDKIIKATDKLIHNFKQIEENHFKVNSGDVLETDDFKLTIRPGNVIELEGEYDSSLMSVDTIETTYPDYPEYTNSPRIKKAPLDNKVDLERIPEKNKDTSTSSLVKKLLPAMVGIIMAILMLWVRPRGIRGILMLVTTLVSFGISMYTLYFDRKDSKEHNALRKATYDQYLLDKRSELASLKLEERTSSNYNYLNLTDILIELDSHSSRLFERDILDDDFLKLRIGTQTAEPNYGINNPFEKLELRYEDADEQLRELYEEYKDIANMPLVIDAKHNIGLVGNRYVISKQMKNILMQSIFNHSYLDLQIVVITDDTYLDDYKYAFSMGHFKDEEKVHNYFVHNTVTRDQYLNGFTQLLRMRDMEYKPGMVYNKHFLFIIDNPALINNHPIREFLEKPEETLGFSMIQVAKTSNELPKHIKTTINFKTEEKAELVLENSKLVNKQFKLPNVDISKQELEIYYRRLSNLEHVKGIKSAVPDTLGFLEMYEVSNPNQLQIANRWKTNKTYKSLAALLGKKSETDYIYLDLHEKIHGPHGLVAGTTGSGKSEVIQTYILSLAIEYSPEQVGFLLIDYKGGGMANLFKDMPHHLGSITNLDGYQSMRALASIKSELKRRQQIFSDNNVNHINNYTKLYEAGQVQEPLPHLFLISDEFAELKAEQPDFMKELVSAARIGRSLGIHLILATQKPDGVVDDQIWSNSKFKLSLKVAEEADSKALLKTPDAAYITNPGRGYLKVGTNELYELFQSGYSGADYSTSSEAKAKPEIYSLDMYGNKSIINPEECTTEQEQDGIAPTELDVVLEEIDNTYNTANLTEVRRPWLPPLISNLIYEINDNKSNELCLVQKIGLVDLPNKQDQIEYTIDLLESGTAAITGSSGMGKTQLLNLIALSLAKKNNAMNLKYYILDFANNGLIHLKDLKHTAEYLTVDKIEEINFLKDMLKQEISNRKHLMAEARVSNFKAFNEVSAKKLQAIVMFLDNYGALENFDEEVKDFIKHIIKEGQNYGVFIVTTASGNAAFKNNILNHISERVVLSNTDKQEVSLLLGKTQYPMQEIPGRGFIKLEEVEVMQSYTIHKTTSEEEKIQELVNLIEEINKEEVFENLPFEKMPDEIQYKPKMYENKLYAGELYSNLQPAAIGMSNILIEGPNTSGKTNLLKLFIEQLKDKKKICILDDTSYSLIEYSQSPNIIYCSDVNDIPVDADVYVINKLNRIERLKNKEKAVIWEKLFLIGLSKKQFIIECGAKGIGNGKEDFIQLIKSSPYYMYLNHPSKQSMFSLDKEVVKKMSYSFGDAFIISSKGINKVKLPKVITGNEDKVFKIPELEALVKSSKLKVESAAVVGQDAQEYINNLIFDNSDCSFKLLNKDNNLDEYPNIEYIGIEKLNELKPTDVLINNAMAEIDSLPNGVRKELKEVFDNLDIKNLITIYDKKYKFTSEKMKLYKKDKKFVFMSDPTSENIQEIFKFNNRRLEKINWNETKYIEVNGKEIKIHKK